MYKQLINIKNSVRISIAFIVATLAVIGLTGFALHQTAAAQSPNIQNNLCGGADNFSVKNVSGTAGYTSNCTKNSNDTNDSLDRIIRQVINIFSLIVGVVAVIMIIIGGFRYITSGGDSNNVGGAKNTIIYAIVGLIIVALAQVIVRFVLGKATTG